MNVDRTAVCELCNGQAVRVVLDRRNERRHRVEWRHGNGATDHAAIPALGTVRRQETPA